MTAEEWAERLIEVRRLDGDAPYDWELRLAGKCLGHFDSEAEAVNAAGPVRVGLVCALSRLLKVALAAARLHPQEWAFARALAENAADVDAACAYADYLEENGRHEAGARVRRLAPQSGDVLAFMVPGDDVFGRVTAAANVTGARLLAHGRRVTCLVLTGGCTLAQVGEDAMRAAGWVRQERVAEAVALEREECARIAETAPAGGDDVRDVADCIRAREANDPVDDVREALEGWPASAGFAPGVVAGDTPAPPTPVAEVEEVADLARQHGEPFGRGATVDIDSPE